MTLTTEPLPALARELIGAYLESARLLGIRTAEMHGALASTNLPDFTPEPFTDHYRQGLLHAFIQQANRTFHLLEQQAPRIRGPAAEAAREVLRRQEEIRARYRALRTQRLAGVRIRHHGDFHLGQVLFTGKDFRIIDFEGEPARPLSERRFKRSPLRDVAGMLRSFEYASHAVLHGQVAGVVPKPESSPALETWAGFWNAWVSSSFLRGYLKAAGEANFLPPTMEELRVMLDMFVLDKALYEVGYEFNNRPDWVGIPLSGILRLLGSTNE